MSESCASCRFFAPSAARGVCRRRPPVWTGPDDTHDEGMFAFPSVHPTSWCGEYEHRPEGTGKTSEPLAWAVMYPNGRLWALHESKSDAEDEASSDCDCEVVPLYRKLN